MSGGSAYARAENGIRTRDLNLGKVALYQLSYFRDWDYKGTTFFLFSKFFLPLSVF